MYKVVEIEGKKQLVKQSGDTMIRERQHDDINEMLSEGVVGEEAVIHWAVLMTDMDIETHLPLSEMPTFTNRDKTEYSI